MVNGVTIKTVEEFQSLPKDMRDAVIFENILEIKQNKGCQIEKCEKRFEEIKTTLRRRKIWNTVASGVGGALGGFIAILTKALWK